MSAPPERPMPPASPVPPSSRRHHGRDDRTEIEFDVRSLDLGVPRPRRDGATSSPAAPPPAMRATVAIPALRPSPLVAPPTGAPPAGVAARPDSRRTMQFGPAPSSTRAHEAALAPALPPIAATPGAHPLPEAPPSGHATRRDESGPPLPMLGAAQRSAGAQSRGELPSYQPGIRRMLSAPTDTVDMRKLLGGRTPARDALPLPGTASGASAEPLVPTRAPDRPRAGSAGVASRVPAILVDTEREAPRRGGTGDAPALPKRVDKRRLAMMVAVALAAVLLAASFALKPPFAEQTLVATPELPEASVASKTPELRRPAAPAHPAAPASTAPAAPAPEPAKPVAEAALSGERATPTASAPAAPVAEAPAPAREPDRAREAAPSSEPGHGQPTAQSAATLYINGNYKEALAEYRLLARAHPDHRVYRELARVLRGKLYQTCIRTQPHRREQCREI